MDPILTADDLENLVLKAGMLPYFKNRITGFSIEENVPDDILWSLDNGPWIWKGILVRNWKVAYGKFFNRKAGYISLELLPDFINLRRSVFDFAAHPVEAHILEVLREHESLLSGELKSLSGFRQAKQQSGKATRIERFLNNRTSKGVRDMGFDTHIMRLQMAGYVVIADFEYKLDRHGNNYGWGVARYTTPEALYGCEVALADDRTPDQSYLRLYKRLKDTLPYTDNRLIRHLLSL